jgi:hypothetical protein
MDDKSSAVFGNPVAKSVARKAARTNASYIKEFGDDSAAAFRLGSVPVPVLENLGVKKLTVTPTGKISSGKLAGALAVPVPDLSTDPNALVVGNIRMGFGHYRMSIAIASAARARGLNPYWFDLHSFADTTGGKVIEKLNGLYSFGSRLSQKSALFNRFYWEPLNSEGFRKLSYNAVDQKVAELMATPCRLLPLDVPYVATHVWPAQAAVHAGMTRVVNVIPDNWPMALHLSEGAVHCVQSPSAWLGYKTLRGMDGKRIPLGMPEGILVYTGHYIDHEIVSNLESDTAARLSRVRGGKSLRVLLSVGGAGAQRDLYAAIIRDLLPRVAAGEVTLFVNVGDHRDVLDSLVEEIPDLAMATAHIDDWSGTRAFAESSLSSAPAGIHLFCDSDIFAAVYATNILMRASDLLVTKPSELAYYPVPKLHVRRVGGHEAWGAIRSAELGDGSVECGTPEETLAMLGLLLDGREALELMNANILAANAAGIYNGAYRAVDIARGMDKGMAR